MPLGIHSKASKDIWNTWFNQNFAVELPGDTKIITTTGATLSAGAYAAGDLIGTKLTFANAARSGKGGLVKSAVLYDKLKVQAGADLILFDSDPTGTTFTDNAAFNVVAADVNKVCGVISFTVAIDYIAFSATAVGQRKNLDIIFDTASGATDIYGALMSHAAASYISGGASPTTYTNLGIRLAVVQA